MFDKIFQTTSYLQKGLDAAWTRHQVIANNVANVNTPDLKASHVVFEDYFQSALEEGSGFRAKKTRSKHMDFGFDFEPMAATVVKDATTTERMDGNNVDIDYEMAELAKNALYYNTLATKATQELTRLRVAITEGR